MKLVDNGMPSIRTQNTVCHKKKKKKKIIHKTVRPGKVICDLRRDNCIQIFGVIFAVKVTKSLIKKYTTFVKHKMFANVGLMCRHFFGNLSFYIVLVFLCNPHAFTSPLSNIHHKSALTGGRRAKYSRGFLPFLLVMSLLMLLLLPRHNK